VEEDPQSADSLFPDEPAQAQVCAGLPACTISDDDPEPMQLSTGEDGQTSFFEMTEWWEEHWKGMPEFSQKDISPYRTLYVHFETREDVAEFFQLVNQHYTPLTQYIWFPKMERAMFSDKRYVDEAGK
jgi:hypothetical protein